MDWAEIEAVVYSEENHPRDILGPRVTEDGILIQAFFPGATRAAVHTIRDGKQTEMVCEDEAGFFAVLLPGKKIPSYTLIYWDGDGNQMEHYDPYAYPMQFTEQEQKQFENGICYSIYEKLGAHPVKIDGVSGVYFAVWAPNAIRVSVVGNFNTLSASTLYATLSKISIRKKPFPTPINGITSAPKRLPTMTKRLRVMY